ncbi:MAG: ATP-binding protein [Rhodobacteraceae bacterium]|jgi:serine/threonine-protein kinase RsbW|nr:ATP-binding protein [Paracoccaceae bacterium]
MNTRAGPGQDAATFNGRRGGASVRAGERSARLVYTVLASEGLAVRAGLRTVTEALAAAGVPEGLCGRVEIAVAEALNNVAEHAYDGAMGPIWLQVGRCRRSGDILCCIADRGRPMPDAGLPAGVLPALDTVLTGLPEGGFGWFLLRALGRGIRYRRAGGVNRLRFRISPEPGEVASVVSTAEPAPQSCHGSTKPVPGRDANDHLVAAMASPGAVCHSPHPARGTGD